MTSLLIIAAIGQIQSQPCIVQRQVYFPVQYQQPQQAYAQQNYVQEEVKFIPVIDRQELYTGLVGQAQRAAERQQQAQQATASTDQKIDQLTRLVLDLQKRLESQPNEPPIPNKPAAPTAESPRPALPALSPIATEAAPLPPTIAQAASSKSAGLALLAAKCAGCHSGRGEKGGGHVLFADGNFAVRDRDLLERIETAIASGSMPKGTKQQLTLREYVSIRDYLNEQASSLAINTINQRKKIR